jgi:uncharacterized RDD family membrane protein YckC
MLPDDRMAVATPEGVTLEFVLAGVGSRFFAGLIDGLIQFAAVVAMLVLAALLESWLGGYIAAVAAIFVFVVFLGYDIAFETLASGRTLGKRWTGLRVVKTSGAPVTFLTSAVRNLLRLVDFLPTTYLIGIVLILATKNNQRLGDLAAGTIVVRERGGSTAPSSDSWTGWTAGGAPGGLAGGLAADELEAWDVSAVTADEVAAVREFLTRRGALTPEARTRVAYEMAVRLRPKVVGPNQAMAPEAFLEAVVAAKSLRA